MTEVPKIVHLRLRAAELGRQAEQTHPEADLLAAFAEQALLPADREGVLAHLALCVDCREAVALALPVVAVALAPVVAETERICTERVSLTGSVRPRNWFAWPNLRWAALTAGVAVAIFAVQVGLEHPGKPKTPETAANHAESSSMQAAPTTQGASELPPAQSPEARAKEAKAKPGAFSRRTTPGAKTQEGQTGALIAGNRPANSAAPDKHLPAPAAGSLASSAPGRAGEMAEASGATTEVATSSSDTGLMAQSQAPSIEKAKPALDESAASDTATRDLASARAPMALQTNGMIVTHAMLPPATTLKQAAAWMIADGILKRSLDGGRNWQTVLQAEHAWLCYAAHGQEVWAGGPAGAVQRSTDGGASWSAVTISAQGQSLSSDVIGIDLRDPAEIAVTTVDHETWTSTDGGKTWSRK